MNQFTRSKMFGNLFAPRSFALILALNLFISGCASYKSRFDDSAEYFKRLESQEKGPLKVSVVGLSARESKKTFGVDLTAKHILPIWMKIENRDPAQSFFFLQRSVDPEYYTAAEAAFMSQLQLGYRLSGKILPPFLVDLARLIFIPLESMFTSRANNAMLAEFESHALRDGWIGSGETREGFMFVPFELGTKEVPIDLYEIDSQTGAGTLRRFDFYVQIPGLRMDYSDKDFETYYKASEIKDIADEATLLKTLGELPCCISSKGGDANGDPMNLIVIGSPEEVLTSFVAAKWDETEIIYPGSIWKMTKSFSFKKNYRYSPISPQYYDGRSQDVAFQKARATINERMHLRLWYSNIRYQGKPVWVGAISRDIGVRFTTKAWNLMTHEIDPDLDESAIYVLSDLMYRHRLEKYGVAGGIPASTAKNPHYNMMGAPYYTAGKRSVLLLSHARHLEIPERMMGGVSPPSEMVKE